MSQEAWSRPMDEQEVRQRLKEMKDDETPGEPTTNPLGITQTTKKREHQPKLTIVDKTYYQAPYEEPITLDASFSHFLSSDEQPYQRKKKAAEGWEEIEYGWLKDPLLFVIKNAEAAKSGLGLEMGFRSEEGNPIVALCLIAPQEQQRITLARSYNKFYIRVASPTKTARYLLTVLPK